MSTIAAGTTVGTALVSTGDTSGQIVLQTNGTTTAVTIGTNQVVSLAQPLPAGSGGTGITTTPTAGAVPYGNGTTLAYTAAGTSGQLLQSNGAAAPSWVAAPSAGYVYLTTVTGASGSNNLDVTTPFTNAYKAFALYYSNIVTGSVGAQPFNLRIFRAGSLVTSNTYGSKSWAPPNNTSINSSADTAIPIPYMYSKTFPMNGWVYINSPYSSLSGGNDNFSIVGSFVLATASSGTPTYWQTYATNSATGTFTGIRLYNPEATWGYFEQTVSVDVYGIK
jgi:hypothetical protein